jgi:diguanylate cyclase (GGDEF)-like protein
MLLAVADTLRARLRPYDVIIRYGGDEFVCVLTGLNLAEASERLVSINTVLAEAYDHVSVTLGIAELQENESLQDLVGRADAALYRERARRPSRAQEDYPDLG